MQRWTQTLSCCYRPTQLSTRIYQHEKNWIQVWISRRNFVLHWFTQQKSINLFLFHVMQCGLNKGHTLVSFESQAWGNCFNPFTIHNLKPHIIFIMMVFIFSPVSITCFTINHWTHIWQHSVKNWIRRTLWPYVFHRRERLQSIWGEIGIDRGEPTLSAVLLVKTSFYDRAELRFCNSYL